MSQLDPELLMTPDEKIVSVTRPHWIVLPQSLFALGALIACAGYLLRLWWTKPEALGNPFVTVVWIAMLAGSLPVGELYGKIRHWYSTRYVLTTRRLLVISGADLLAVTLTPEVRLSAHVTTQGRKPFWGKLIVTGAGEASVSWAIVVPGAMSRSGDLQLNMKGVMQPGGRLRFDGVARPVQFLETLRGRNTAPELNPAQ